MMSWLPNLILGQFYIVLGLAAYTLLLLFVRKSKAARKKKLSDKYLDLLTAELVAPSRESIAVKKWQSVKLNRDVFHEALMTQMKLVAGDDREYLLKLYDQLNFKARDIDQCKSFFWAKRLKAVIHMGALEMPELAPVFQKMAQDPEPLVAVAAILSLSRLNHPINSPELIREIPKGLLKRSNALNELIANIGLQHGVEPLVWSVRNSPSLRIVKSSLRALRHLRTSDATEAMIDLLSFPGNLPASCIRDLIETLNKIGDPSCIAATRRYLYHKAPTVRAESALLLLRLRDKESYTEIETLRRSSDVNLQRLLRASAALPTRLPE